MRKNDVRLGINREEKFRRKPANLGSSESLSKRRMCTDKTDKNINNKRTEIVQTSYIVTIYSSTIASRAYFMDARQC